MTRNNPTERLRRALSPGVFLFLAVFPPPRAAAQLIAVKTLPIADANQFSFFPSLTAGMGGVSIALRDSLHDPFMNPATGARLSQPLFFSAPTFFSVTANAGSGTTFPIGLLTRSGRTFGGAALAVQSIANSSPGGANQFIPVPEGRATDSDGYSKGNRYGFAMLGQTLGTSQVTLGASAFLSDLGTVDGTAMMYAESRRVNQSGRAADVRLGLLKEWGHGHALEALVFDRRMGVTHNVTYGDVYWDALNRRPITIDRTNNERDRSRTMGVQLAYARPVGDSGWRAGVTVTANRVRNASRPSYEIEAIPGDRGRAAAFNVGVGVARSLGRTLLAADAIYEPIWSRIWDESDTSSAAAPGPNERIVDSRLRFSNGVMRMGMSHDLTQSNADSKVQMQLGLQAHSIHYTFDQQHHLSGTTREGSRSWMEWTRTWGLTLRRAGVVLTYRGRHLTGVERPTAGNELLVPLGPVLLDGIRPFTTSPATLRDVSVITHQLSMSLAIR